MDGLTYEKLDRKHSKDLAAVWSDEEVIRYTNIKEPCTLEEIKERIERLMPFDIYCCFDKGEFIGILGCPPISREKGKYGVFYQLKKAAWGKGHGKQVAAWLIQTMRAQYGNLTFYADVVTLNVASEKILQHLGFKLTFEEKDTFERDGKKMTIHHYLLDEQADRKSK